MIPNIKIDLVLLILLYLVKDKEKGEMMVICGSQNNLVNLLDGLKILDQIEPKPVDPRPEGRLVVVRPEGRLVVVRPEGRLVVVRLVVVRLVVVRPVVVRLVVEGYQGFE
jgi:hypothetical protein